MTGQDVVIGTHHIAKGQLLTESTTFRVLEPLAAVAPGRATRNGLGADLAPNREQPR